jgi:hypothetical protein
MTKNLANNAVRLSSVVRLLLFLSNKGRCDGSHAGRELSSASIVGSPFGVPATAGKLCSTLTA